MKAEDNCEVNAEITEYDGYKFTKKGKRIHKTESCEVELSGDTITILDSGGVGTSISWTAAATDSSGNVVMDTFEIEVIKPGK